MLSAMMVRALGPAMAYPAYRAYWFGTLASVSGFQMLNFSQFWIIHRLTHDPMFLGYVGLASAIPSIVLNIFGGVLADRLERRRLIAITQTVNGLLIIVLTLLTFTGIVQPFHVIVLAFLAGAVNAFDQPARQALYPALIEHKVMMNAVALNSAIWTGTRIVAPAFAGLIITLAGEGTSFLLSSLGFFAMAVIVMSIDIPSKVPTSTGSSDESRRQSDSHGGGLLEGVKFIAGNNIFLFLISMTFFNSFFGMSYIPMMPVFAVEILKVGADGQGVLMGLGGVGALGMTIVLGRIGNFKQRGWLIIVGSLLFGLFLAAFAYTAQILGNYILAMSLMFLMGASSSIYMISIMSSLQLMVPDNMRGRVMGFYGMTWSIMPLGGIFAGGLASLLGNGSDGVPVAVALGGLAVALFAIGPALLNGNVRSVGVIIEKYQISEPFRSQKASTASK